MELVGVRVERPANSPALLLQETEGERRMLSIYIGGAEATAIAFAVDGIEPPRPGTHDLFISALTALGVEVERVVISALRDRTFYAELHMSGPEGSEILSARPSDAVALAARADAPIFAEESVLDEAGYGLEPESPEGDPEEMVEDFRKFIDEVNPEDFAS